MRGSRAAIVSAAGVGRRASCALLATLVFGFASPALGADAASTVAGSAYVCPAGDFELCTRPSTFTVEARTADQAGSLVHTSPDGTAVVIALDCVDIIATSAFGHEGHLLRTSGVDGDGSRWYAAIHSREGIDVALSQQAGAGPCGTGAAVGADASGRFVFA